MVRCTRPCPAAVTAAVHVPAACGGGRRPPSVVQGATESDRDFLDQMAVLLETARVSAGQAVDQATRAELKEYAGHIRDEHARQVSAVRSLDQALFDHDPGMFSVIPPLIALGANFDREWLTNMIELEPSTLRVRASTNAATRKPRPSRVSYRPASSRSWSDFARGPRSDSGHDCWCRQPRARVTHA
jgi:hypothetical protein